MENSARGAARTLLAAVARTYPYLWYHTGQVAKWPRHMKIKLLHDNTNALHLISPAEQRASHTRR
eukprot:1505-Heterococcus_DN1.PRE.3